MSSGLFQNLGQRRSSSQIGKPYGYQTRSQIEAKVQIEYERFLARLCNGPGLAVTVTFTDDALSLPKGEVKRHCEKTGVHLIRRIHKRIYRHGYNRKGFRTWSAAVLEGGGLHGRLHIHIAIGIPSGYSGTGFRGLVAREIKACRDLAREVDIQPITSAGWIGYMAKHGLEALLLDCCNTARS